MRFTTAALILPLAVSSFAAELPDKTISISYLKTTVRKDTLEMHEVSLIAEVAEEEKTFYCESKGNETPEYPDTLDCEMTAGDKTSGTFRFSIHAPVPQIVEPTVQLQLLEPGFSPTWASPIIIYTEWDSGKARTFGSIKVPDRKLETQTIADNSITFVTPSGTKPLKPDVTTLPN